MIHGVRTVGSDLHFKDGIRTFAGNAFDRDADGSQIFGEPAIVDGKVNELANPLWRELHYFRKPTADSQR
jgi:hypothetical protein